MRVPGAFELVQIWEAWLGQPPALRPLTLLAWAYPEFTPQELARLSIGRRDGLLMSIREHMFGSAVQTVSACPACGEQADVSFTIGDIRTPDAGPQQERYLCSVDNYQIGFRLPDSNDLLQVAAGHSGSDTEWQPLFYQCLTDVHLDAKPVPAGQLPPGLTEFVIEQMAAYDPQADVQILMQCPACGQVRSVIFDIAQFLEREIGNRAVQLLHEVHRMATAYGWSERDILGMSALRRRLYLDMIG